MKFYYVYVLKSLNYNFIYVGFTTDLRKRFSEHNNKEELSTKQYSPFSLIHYEAYRNIKDAKRREEYFLDCSKLPKTAIKKAIRVEYDYNIALCF